MRARSNFETFFENGRRWERVNQSIVSARSRCIQSPFPAMDELLAGVKHDVDYQQHLWGTDYEAAVEAAESVLGCLIAPELRGYRALWHYLAGSAAKLGVLSGVPSLGAKARLHYSKAKQVVTIPWLVKLARFQPDTSYSPQDRTILWGQIERIERVISSLGTVHDRAYAQREKDIISGLAVPDTFESAHKMLGEMLGFDAGKLNQRARLIRGGWQARFAPFSRTMLEQKTSPRLA